MSKSKIAQILKSSIPTFKKINFWVSSMKGKTACLKFGSVAEAENAQQILDGFVFAYNSQEHVMNAEVCKNGDLRNLEDEREDLNVPRLPVKRKFGSSNPYDELSKVEVSFFFLSSILRLVTSTAFGIIPRDI